MIPFALSELAALDQDIKLCLPPEMRTAFKVTAVTADSRTVSAGALFIALAGERFDGHNFLDKAAAAGAGMLGISAAFAAAHPDAVNKQVLSGRAVIIAPDTLRLLGLCGLAVRLKTHAKFAALSGSCGKTTVKEMTAAILSRCGRTLATSGNFNNDVGVPLTLLRLTDDLDYAIIEQGASHLKDLARTCEFVRADCALLTNVGQAHLEGFGSACGVYQGKNELLQDVLGRGGLIAFPGEGEWTERFLSDYSAAVKAGRAVSFGRFESAASDPARLVSAADIKSGPAGISFTLVQHHQTLADGRQFEPQEAQLTLNMLGAHNAVNAAAAAALAILAGASFAEVKAGLEGCLTLSGRLKLISLGAVTLIDDAYNAGFNAVLAGIETLAGFTDCCRVLVLGDMGELGAASVSLHFKVGEAACGKCEALFALGPLSAHTAAAFNGVKQHFTSHDKLNAALAAWLDAKLQAGQRCCVLVKGSHSMQMQRVNDFLTARYGH